MMRMPVVAIGNASPEYAARDNQPPCPWFAIAGRIAAWDGAIDAQLRSSCASGKEHT